MELIVGISIFAISLLMLNILCIIRRKRLGIYFKIITPICSILFILSFILLILQLIGISDKQSQNIISKRSEESRKMDMIMWYDIDIGPTSNDRPQNGWWYLNPQHPNTVKVNGCYRTTTPLLGLYDQRKPETARQHLYWIAALGCNVIAADWTNYSSYRTAENQGWLKYTNGVYKNTEVLLQESSRTKDFDAPKVYATVRLNGEDYEKLKDVLDDVYTLYNSYKDAWYKLDDGTKNADKPFIVVFADQSILKKYIDEGNGFTDDRFNIRMSNGYLGSITVEEKKNRSIPFGNWLFVEAEKNDDSANGLYKTYYAKGKNGKPEQMIGWASVHQGGMSWDIMNNVIEGKTTFERTIWNVKNLNPKALLINRFNYAVAWKEEPQEGLSLYECTNIEPNEDFGFLVFDNVKENLYKLNSWEENSIKSFNAQYTNGNIIVPLEGYPTEYRLSSNSDMSNSTWIYLNVNEWIERPEVAGSIYLQLRNCFGESEIVKIE